LFLISLVAITVFKSNLELIMNKFMQALVSQKPWLKPTFQSGAMEFFTFASSNKYNDIEKTLRELSQKHPWDNEKKAFKTLHAIQSYLLSTEINSPLNSKAIIREEPQEQGDEPSLRIAKQKEIDLATTFAIGGADSDLLKYVQLLAAKHPHSKECLPLMIFPEVTQEERYKDAVEYTLHSDYYPPYIKQRVEEFLLPRVLKNIASEEVSKFSLFSFGMGGREVMMMQTALRDILDQQFYLPKTLIDTIMSDITAICVGYAPSINAFEDYGFKKIIIFSLDDKGVFIPYDLYEFVLSQRGVLTKDLVVHQMHKVDDAPQYLIISGKESTDPDKSNYTTPTISDYFNYIEEMPEDIIDIIGKSITPSNDPSNEF